MKHIKLFESFRAGDHYHARQYRSLINNNASIEEIKKFIDEFSKNKQLGSRPGPADKDNVNMFSCHAAESGRKDVIKYLFDNNLLHENDLTVLHRWVKHTTKLDPDQKMDMVNFLDTLYPELKGYKFTDIAPVRLR